MLSKGVYFVSGIDTDCGKSHVTGVIARDLLGRGVNVVTQKLIQTGCRGISEDILTHRQIMGIDLLDVDRDLTTCPIVYSHPCSPHLAARIDDRQIDLEIIRRSTRTLAQRFEVVLVEGAGGLMVPLKDDYLMSDYPREMNLPIVFVTTPKLGSINHTLLNLDYCRSQGLDVAVVVYNVYGENLDPVIVDDTRDVIKGALAKYMPRCEFWELREDKIMIEQKR